MTRPRPPQTRLFGSFSSREREILRAHADGESYASIAARLGMTPGRIAQMAKNTRDRMAILDRARTSFASGDPLDTPVELLPLPTRAIHVLLTYGKRTLRDVSACSVTELLRMKNLGAVSVREIQDVVRRHTAQ
jgi:DNA-directed RNA polymerase alpha subunit